METPADYTDDSIAAFLTAVADMLETCADRGTQGRWQVSQSPRTFITNESGGVICGAVQKSNARLILAASPDGPRTTAALLRAVAEQPVTEQSLPARDAAFAMAMHLNSQMMLKADSRLRAGQGATN
ncbi:MAG: hypothetical protein DI630_24410 [Gordonia sp. (in: high G+C Gram-positive bacteria)]|nr:MAG: hypothetical protein DI630_24410 [Gordonia sp. (in: high G+C Gram-positive bacteria)]